MGPLSPRRRRCPRSASAAQSGRPVSSRQSTSATSSAGTTSAAVVPGDGGLRPARSSSPAGTSTGTPAAARATHSRGVRPAEVHPARGGAAHLVRGRRGRVGRPQVALQHPRAAVPGDLVVHQAGAGPQDGDVAGGQRRPVAPPVPQRAGEHDGDDVDGARARARRSRAPAPAGRRRPAAAAPATVVGVLQHTRAPARSRPSPAAPARGRRAARPAAARRRARPADPQRPAAHDVGQEVHAQPHPGQPDQEHEQHARGRPQPARRRGEPRPGEHQAHGHERGDARGVPAREAQPAVLQPRRPRRPAGPGRRAP